MGKGAWRWCSLALVAFVGILCLFVNRASASPAGPSPEPNLICHTSDPKDCYPKIFVPTDEFQIVHEDQDLPPGLHVRLNISTGKKEAKINIPDEENPALEGLPVDQAVVLVDQEQPVEPIIPKGAPAYEAVGKIKEPEHHASSFFDALKIVKGASPQNGQEYDDALDGMEEISHDIYYGLKITEDPEVLKALLCLMADHNSPVAEGVRPRDQQAAMILSSAVQNNPSALKEVAKQWSDIMGAQCPTDNTKVNDGFYASFVPSDTSDVTSSKPAALRAKAKVAAISGLIRDESIRKEFMSQGGMQRLLEVLVPQGKEWAAAQRRVGQLMLDNFLDPDMGATVGQWPTVPKVDDSQCKATTGQMQEGCWDYHVERIMNANKGDDSHWSKDVHDRLATLRKNEGVRHSDL